MIKHSKSQAPSGRPEVLRYQSQPQRERELLEQLLQRGYVNWQSKFRVIFTSLLTSESHNVINYAKDLLCVTTLIYDHNCQTSFPLTPLGQLKPNFMWSFLGKMEHKFCKNHLSHMTKMAAMPIYSKNL